LNYSLLDFSSRHPESAIHHFTVPFLVSAIAIEVRESNALLNAPFVQGAVIGGVTSGTALAVLIALAIYTYYRRAMEKSEDFTCWEFPVDTDIQPFVDSTLTSDDMAISQEGLDLSSEDDDGSDAYSQLSAIQDGLQLE
jgi:hypothetical protein